MTHSGIIGIVLILVNIACSYKGFNNEAFFDGYKFQVDKILVNKDYKRLATSGFLHVNWMHLIFNMVSLYMFSGTIEGSLGPANFLIIYFASLVGGGLLALFIHRHHNDYNAAGASGAISGVIFASIALFPGIGVGFFGLPIFIPGWLYGLLFVAVSVYGIRSKKDNIGHEGHLGGALVGLAVALIIRPSALTYNYVTILLITIPALLFIYLIVTRPNILLVDNLFHKTHTKFYTIDHKYNKQKADRQQEVDRILDKINRKGINSLSSKERKILKNRS